MNAFFPHRIRPLRDAIAGLERGIANFAVLATLCWAPLLVNTLLMSAINHTYAAHDPAGFTAYKSLVSEWFIVAPLVWLPFGALITTRMFRFLVFDHRSTALLPLRSVPLAVFAVCLAWSASNWGVDTVSQSTLHGFVLPRYTAGGNEAYQAWYYVWWLATQAVNVTTTCMALALIALIVVSAPRGLRPGLTLARAGGARMIGLLAIAAVLIEGLRVVLDLVVTWSGALQLRSDDPYDRPAFVLGEMTYHGIWALYDFAALALGCSIIGSGIRRVLQPTEHDTLRSHAAAVDPGADASVETP